MKEKFQKERKVDERVCNFLDLPVGTNLTNCDLTKKIWVKLSEQQKEKDRNEIIHFICQSIPSEVLARVNIT